MSAPAGRLRSGVFLAPFHALNEDPTAALRRDLELMEHLDRLGFDEAWVGEHHSAGYEIIASPELFIAAAAERTRHIRLGTGVVSLPYHNPLMVADRIIQLDHQTRGRVMFGVGPGLLPSDAEMLGIPVEKQRHRMAESLAVILRLMAGETVSYECEWFRLVNARCQLLPYTHPRPEVAVASTITPSGARLAGQHDLGLLCVAATQVEGYDALATNWRIACSVANEHGRRMSRSRLRLVAPMHLASSREQAMRDVEHGLRHWLDYFTKVNPAGRLAVTNGQDPVDAFLAGGFAVVGTPDDMIAKMESLAEQSGGYGCQLLLAHNWADFDATKRSYELFARHVMPHFTGANRARSESLASYVEQRESLTGKAVSAVMTTMAEHQRDIEAAQALGDDGPGARPKSP